MNEKIDVTVKGLAPFKKFCMTIGELPSSYVETMSYYEMLVWFTKYLTETVIPTINNNAEAVEEVQQIVMEFQDYINNYFDNLDVQEQINTKLNSMAMSGELANIINDTIFNDLNSKVLQNTVDIQANKDELETTVKADQTNSITMNMLTQEVRTAMTGGSTAVVGEDSIGEVNIQDKAITIYKLDDYLQSTKSISYGDPIDVGSRYAGFMRNLNGVADVEGETGTSYSHFIVNLTKDKIYAFTGYNVSLSCGILVVDQSENVIYDSNPDAQSSNPRTPTSLIFKVNQSNLRAYISIFNNLYDVSTYNQNFMRYNTPLLREIEIFTNNFKKIEPRLITTLTGKYASYQHDTDGLPKIVTYNSTNMYIYEMVKGMKYNLKSYNWAEVPGIYILGLDNSIIYQSSNASVGSTHVEVTRNFIAAQDGYIMLFEHGNYKPTINIVYDLINPNPETQSEYKLGFSKWYALGDSLTEVNFRASKNYVGYIQDELDITVVNLGHSSSGYMNSNSSNQNFRTEIAEISNYDYESDIITVMGSINDFQYIANNLGQLGDTGTDTLYGCIYNFCNDLFTSFIGARIGIICPPPNNIYHSDYSKFQAYNTAIKETAKLFSIPVLDLSEKSNLKPWIQAFQTEFFTADGTGNAGQSDQTHPNSKGHWLLHNEIKQFLKTL